MSKLPSLKRKVSLVNWIFLLLKRLCRGIRQTWYSRNTTLSSLSIWSHDLYHIFPPINWPPPAKYMSLDKTSNLHTSFIKLSMIKRKTRHLTVCSMVPIKNTNGLYWDGNLLFLYTPEICYKQYVVQIPGEVYLLLSGTSPRHFLLDFLISFPIHQAYFWTPQFALVHCWDHYCQGKKCCSCSVI